MIEDRGNCSETFLRSGNIIPLPKEDSPQRSSVLEEIIIACSSVMKSIKTMMNEKLKDYDMTFGEFNILMFLAQGTADTSKDMVRDRGYSRSLVSKMVDQLLRREFITSLQDPSDRRIMHLKLTEKGEEFVQEARRFSEKIDQMLEKSISSEEMHVLKAVLGHIQECFEQQSRE